MGNPNSGSLLVKFRFRVVFYHEIVTATASYWVQRGRFTIELRLHLHQCFSLSLSTSSHDYHHIVIVMKSIRTRYTNTISLYHRVGTFHQPCYHVIHLSQTSRCYHAAPLDIYQKLNYMKNEIRVLQIEPGRWDDAISCRLKVVSLDRLPKPRYDTLSYTWGSSGSTKVISVDRHTIDVSTNLFTALRALRRRFVTVTIWADALCINQKSNREKSKQVALMGRIYQQGCQTWISLGCPDENWADGSWSPPFRLPESAPLLKRLIRGVWRIFWHYLILRRSRRSKLGVEHVADALRLMKLTRSDHDMDDLDRQHERTATSMLTWIANHEYWSRVWVVQEIALSRYDPICLFGRHQIPLLSLDTVFSDWMSPEPEGSRCSPEIEKNVFRA